MRLHVTCQKDWWMNVPHLLTLRYALGEISMLDVPAGHWRSLKPVASAMKLMPVRHTATVVRSRLFVLGGGANCYMFGTAFSDPALLDISALREQAAEVAMRQVPLSEGSATNEKSQQLVRCDAPYLAASDIKNGAKLHSMLTRGADPACHQGAGGPHATASILGRATSCGPPAATAAPWQASYGSQGAQRSTCENGPDAPCVQLCDSLAMHLCCALEVPTRSVKAVKDALKALSWLDSTFRPVTHPGPPPQVALPVNPAGVRGLKLLSAPIASTLPQPQVHLHASLQRQALRACEAGPSAKQLATAELSPRAAEVLSQQLTRQPEPDPARADQHLQVTSSAGRYMASSSVHWLDNHRIEDAAQTQLPSVRRLEEALAAGCRLRHVPAEAARGRPSPQQALHCVLKNLLEGHGIRGEAICMRGTSTMHVATVLEKTVMFF